MKVDPDIASQISGHLLASAEVKKETANSCVEQIAVAASMITDSLQKGGKLLLCGNGGSAADCQHFAAEFVSRLTKDFSRPAIPAIALTTDTSFLTAFGNDCGFDGVFARQIEALGQSGDVLVAISTSGESANIIEAVAAARNKGVRIVALTGTKGRLKEIADAAVCVPGPNTQHIQEAHLAIEHIICHLVERALFKPEKRPS